jgi:predicted amidohydrolase
MMTVNPLMNKIGEIMRVISCQTMLCILFITALFGGQKAMSQNTPDQGSPIHIELAEKNGFATMTHTGHQNNRIGYRFHEHEPIEFGKVPLSESQANIDADEMNRLEDEYKNSSQVFVYTEHIEKDEAWVKQDWTFYMKPVQDGVEILLTVRTFNQGLPAYYGIQQCFRLGGESNNEWRRKIANTPAFSEYELWRRQSGDKKSLTRVMRNQTWQVIPADEKTLGARTPMGMAIDDLRTRGNLMLEVSPYKAVMQAPVDHGLITRVDISETWVCGIYWQNTSHVTNHHPADCLHSIVNIGNIPPFSKRAIQGKIYWFEGSPDSLFAHFKNDFLEGKQHRRLEIASCQFPVSGDITANADWIKKQMRWAKVQSAELVQFPECALSGYGGADIKDFGDYDWNLLKAETGSILELTKTLKLWVLLGSSHRLSRDHKPHNSLYLVNPEGKIIDRYDKRFCTTGDLDYYTPGDHFVTFDINDIKCGLLICYDVRFPELYREYSKLGVEVLFQSFYNARHREDCIHPKIMPVTAQARAATNAFFMSLSNSSAPYSWPCYSITPDGLVEKKLPANKAGILLSTIDAAKKYYDPSKPFRKETIDGKLHSGATVQDPCSEDRTVY